MQKLLMYKRTLGWMILGFGLSLVTLWFLGSFFTPSSSDVRIITGLVLTFIGLGSSWLSFGNALDAYTDESI